MWLPESGLPRIPAKASLYRLVNSFAVDCRMPEEKGVGSYRCAFSAESLLQYSLLLARVLSRLPTTSEELAECASEGLLDYPQLQRKWPNASEGLLDCPQLQRNWTNASKELAKRQ